MKRYRHSELQLFENSFRHCVNDRNRIVRLLIFSKIYAVAVVRISVASGCEIRWGITRDVFFYNVVKLERKIEVVENDFPRVCSDTRIARIPIRIITWSKLQRRATYTSPIFPTKQLTKQTKCTPSKEIPIRDAFDEHRWKRTLKAKVANLEDS